MSFGGSSQPNPYATANAQTGSNVNSAIMQELLNNLNVNSPYGSSTFNQTGSTNVGGYNIPQFSQNISLSPAEQQILDAQQKAQGSLTGGATQNLVGQINSSSMNPFSLGGYNNLTTNVEGGPVQKGFNQGQQIQGQVGPAGGAQAIQDAENAAYEQQAAYLRPQQAQQTEQQNASLAEQGITQGSDAYNNAQSELGRNQTFANQQAQNAAVQAGQQEQNTLYGQALESGEFANTAAGQQFGQNLAAGQFGNTAQQQQYQQDLQNAQLGNQAKGQQFNQAYQTNNLPYNQLSAIMGNTQITNPQANAPSQGSIGASPIGSYIAQNYQNQLGSANNTNSGAFGLGGTLGAAAINNPNAINGAYNWLTNLA